MRMNSELFHHIQENRHILKCCAEGVLYCGQQCIDDFRMFVKIKYLEIAMVIHITIPCSWHTQYMIIVDHFRLNTFMV